MGAKMTTGRDSTSNPARALMPPPVRLPVWTGYVFIILLHSFHILLLVLLNTAFPDATFRAPFLLATIAAAYLFGAGVAVLSILISVTIYIVLYLPPVNALHVPQFGPSGWAELTGLFIGLVLVSWAGWAIGKLTRRLRSEVQKHAQAEEDLRGQQSLLSTVLNTVPVGVILSDKEGSFTYFSAGASDLLGGPPSGTASWPAPGTYEVLHPADRRPFEPEELPLTQAIRSGECSEEVEMLIRRSDGIEVTVLTVACPVKDSGGRVTGSVAALTDISEMVRLRAEVERDSERLSALYGIAEIGITATSLQDALETLAARMREVLHSHSCSIFTLDENTAEFVARAACNIPGLVGHRLPTNAGVSGIIYHEQRPVYVADAEHDPLVRDPSEKRGHIKALLAVPLIARGRLIGMVRVDEMRERVFSPDEVSVLEAMADRAATIIDNAELVENLANNYTLLQRALLPPTPPAIPDYRIAATYLPGARGTKIGGDFYDIFLTEDGYLGIIIGDVTGKGIPAASLAADTRSTLRAFAYDTSRPGEALSHTNSVISTELQDSTMFVTVLAAVVEHLSGGGRYADAGHPPAVIWHRESDDVEFTHYGDPPVGVSSVTRFSEHSVTCSPGDKLIFYTDGLSEARANGETFGLERIAEVVRAYGSKAPQDLLEALVNAGLSWSGGQFSDDTAIIVVECEQG